MQKNILKGCLIKMKDLITTVLVAIVVGTIVYFADNRLNDIYCFALFY